MFLMNASPLVALQRKWEPFAPSRSCRYPVCFSESEDDLARTAVSAKVQVIINNLQSEEPSLGSSGDYGCVLQKKQRGGKGRGQKLQSAGRLLRKHVPYAQQPCPADSDGMEVEEGPEFGPPSLRSDSDDSVDRDIEEAIQEYLRNKSQAVRPPPGITQSFRAAGGEAQVPREPSPSDSACNAFPAQPRPEQAQRRFSAGEPGGEGVHASSSPRSTSSDDSFEQSIRAEIEQFLSAKKKQEARRRSPMGTSRPLEERQGWEKQGAVSRRLGPSRESQSPLKRGGRALPLRQRPEVLSKLEPNPREERPDSRTCPTRLRKSFPCRPCAQVPDRAGERRRRSPPKTRGKPRSESVEHSDSSSDDGIEEAIQLYQLEKSRKAADLRGGGIAFQQEGFGPGGTEDPSAELPVDSLRSTLPASPRRGLSSKRRAGSARPAGGNFVSSLGSQPKTAGGCAPLEPPLARRVAPFQGSCRADTAAELMCAEAILDISKTILPPPTGSGNQPFPADPSFRPQIGLPARPESDCSAVDSDDSIEEEIRAFLAVKAQGGRLGPRVRPPRAFKLSLNRKRSAKAGSAVPRRRPPAQFRLLTAGCSCGDGSHAKPPAPQKQEGENPTESSETGGGSRGQQDPLLPVRRTDCTSPRPQGPTDAKGPARNATQGPQKYGSGDKSSSLDSDEDLDTAIKDLLRSKRKLKKKPKEQRIQCKKKVRFSEPEMCVFEAEERGCKSNTPASLKGCLTTSKGGVTGGDGTAEPLSNVRGKPKNARPECQKECRNQAASGPETQEESGNHSFTDSDDGIEQEIQRFLAEKAKDSSAHGARPPRAEGTDEAPPVERPGAAPSKAKGRPLKAGSSALSGQNKKGKRAGAPVTQLRMSLGPEEGNAENVSCGRETTAPHKEHAHNQPAVKSQAKRGTAEPKVPSFPARGRAAVRKLGGGHRAQQGSLPSGTGRAETPKAQSYLKSLFPFKRKALHEFRLSSKFIAGLRNAHGKKDRRVAELSLPGGWEGSSAANLPAELCDVTRPGSRSETVLGGAGEFAWDPAEARPPSAGNQGKPVATLRDARENPAKAIDLRGQAPCCSAEPSQSGAQRCSFGAGSASNKVSAGEGAGSVLEQGFRVPSSPGTLPVREELPALQTQRAKEQRNVSEEASAEFTHRPVVPQAYCWVKSKVSNL